MVVSATEVPEEERGDAERCEAAYDAACDGAGGGGVRFGR